MLPPALLWPTAAILTPCVPGVIGECRFLLKPHTERLVSVPLVAGLQRELYNWVVLLRSCSASSDLWGLEIAGGEAVSGSSLAETD